MKFAIAINAVLLIACALLWQVKPILTELDVCMNYTELDREGVINEQALSKFHPSYGFANNQRRTVPMYIAKPALSAAQTSAAIGCLATSVSLATLLITMYRLRTKLTHNLRNAGASEQQHGVSR